MPSNWKTFAQEKESAEPADEEAEVEAEEEPAMFRIDGSKPGQITSAEKNKPTGGAVYGGKDEKGEKSKKSK